jgi:N-acetylglucosamine kinase-like BadF-type ATPase
MQCRHMSASPLVFGADSGASGTRLVIGSQSKYDLRADLPSLNPASVDDQAASWRALAALLPQGSGHRVRGCIATASMSAATADGEVAYFRAAAAWRALSGTVLLINDAAALLLGPPLNGTGVVVSVGTGTAFWARDSRGAVRSASGYEYIASDEGGGFDIGRCGIQAAARAYDGRGPATHLLVAAERRYGLGIPALGRQLATSHQQKRDVGLFAPDVCRLAATDKVAAQILDDACRSVMLGVRSVIDGTREAPTGIVCAGSMIAGPTYFAAVLRNAMEREWPSLKIHEVTKTALTALSLAEHLEHAAALAKPPIAARVVTF